MRLSTTILLSAVALVLVCAGCEKQFTRPNYETIYIGEPASAVQESLGEPTVKFNNEWNYVNTSPFYKATIYYRDGKVVKKLWFGEKEMPGFPAGTDARHTGTQPATSQPTPSVQ
jgi:hypothetical protein